MKPYETQTFDKTGPNGEPLKLIVELHADEDSQPEFYGELCSLRDLRGPCYHLDSMTVILGDPKRWEWLLSDIETTAENARHLARISERECVCRDKSGLEDCEDCLAVIVAEWLELRDIADDLLSEDYSADAYDAVKHHLERDGSNRYVWANLNTAGNYNGEPKDKLREYCEQDGKRLREWALNHWHYCGVAARVEDANGREIAEAAVRGFEDDDKSLRNLETHEVAEEAMRYAARELTERHRAACGDVVTA